MVHPRYKLVWELLRKVNIELPCGPAIPLLAIYPPELKIYAHTKICTQSSILALFIIAPKRKQSICSLTDG